MAEVSDSGVSQFRIPELALFKVRTLAADQKHTSLGPNGSEQNTPRFGFLHTKCKLIREPYRCPEPAGRFAVGNAPAPVLVTAFFYVTLVLSKLRGMRRDSLFFAARAEI
ncbi:UNVERIFIED_CONTAM: hypothetical protein K2H54_042216 [Gekko kuhli]